jgi:hypothetical protein
VALGWLDPCVLGHYLPGVANDVFNSKEVVSSCHLTMLRACVAWHWVVGLPDNVVFHREWAAGWHYTVVACCEWPVDRHCPIVVLQTPCPYVFLALNVVPAACLACA